MWTAGLPPELCLKSRYGCRCDQSHTTSTDNRLIAAGAGSEASAEQITRHRVAGLLDELGAIRMDVVPTTVEQACAGHSDAIRHGCRIGRLHPTCRHGVRHSHPHELGRGDLGAAGVGDGSRCLGCAQQFRTSLLQGDVVRVVEAIAPDWLSSSVRKDVVIACSL